MQKGRGGMGMHKHGTSGHTPHSPRFRQMRDLETNRALEERLKKKPKTTMVESVRQLFKGKQ